MSVRALVKRNLRIIGSRLPGAREKELFFIYTTPRAGSYFMVDCLNRTEGVKIVSEILNPDASIGLDYGVTKDKCRSHIEQVVYSQRAEVAGAKLMLTQMKMHVLRITDMLKWFPFARGVLFFREDLFAQYLSIQKDKLRAEWKNLTEREIQEQQIEFDPDEFLKWSRQTVVLYEKAILDAGLSRLHVVSYEGFCDDPATALRSLVPNRSIQDQQGFQIRVPDSKRLAKSVENYHEMVETCGDSRWLQYSSSKFTLEARPE